MLKWWFSKRCTFVFVVVRPPPFCPHTHIKQSFALTLFASCRCSRFWADLKCHLLNDVFTFMKKKSESYTRIRLKKSEREKIKGEEKNKRGIIKWTKNIFHTFDNIFWCIFGIQKKFIKLFFRKMKKNRWKRFEEQYVE